MIKACETCGKRYRANKPDRRFCGKVCFDEWQANRNRRDIEPVYVRSNRALPVPDFDIHADMFMLALELEWLIAFDKECEKT